MASSAEIEIDAWLRDGGIVVAASDRAARALTSGYHRRRQADKLTAWNAPRIFSWRDFVGDAWTGQAADGRMLLNPAQELALWTQIAGRDNLPATALDGPRRRVAALAAEAHELLATHAVRYLQPGARAAWQQDAAVFSGWLAEFEKACGAENLLAMSRMPLELIALLERGGDAGRAPLLVVGFDRILPVQRRLFDAWGSWREAAPREPATDVAYYAAADVKAELAACAIWCRQKFDADPRSRLLVVTRDVSARRGEIERAFLHHAGARQFEFSLGVPLAQAPLARAAVLMLRWLDGPIDESELDWLIATGHASASEQETAALHRHMREIRRRNRQRTRWTLEAFCRERGVAEPLPAAWVAHMSEAEQRLAAAGMRDQGPVEWAALAPKLLKSAGWPGARALSSVEFQAANRWQQALDTCGSLGFDGRRMRWREFLNVLWRALEETLFAQESRDAPIQIAGPAESAGLEADAVWVLGASEDAWPAGGSSHPFLPLHVQREGAMPHATAQLDWALARTVTQRLLASAREIRFSYAKQSEGAEARPSRLVTQFIGAKQPLPASLSAAAQPEPATELFEDLSRAPLARTEIRGGAAVLTTQSQCAFKAFATVRLGAQGWDAAEAGLTAKLRGQLVHAALAAVWGEPRGVRTQDELRAIGDLAAFVDSHVDGILHEKIPAGVRERMPHRYLNLEGARLARLVRQWLEYELTRRPFRVDRTEAPGNATIKGLRLDLRLDRVDRLIDESLLVIDYKTGDVSAGSWDLPRPDDVQLPLYAEFALEGGESLGGLVFAKVRTGDGKREFAGRLRDADGTLLEALTRQSSLVKDPLTDAQLAEWRACIEQLAQDFVAGRADVDPRDYPRTCESCELHALCRVRERGAIADEEDEAGGEDRGDE